MLCCTLKRCQKDKMWVFIHTELRPHPPRVKSPSALPAPPYYSCPYYKERNTEAHSLFFCEKFLRSSVVLYTLLTWSRKRLSGFLPPPGDFFISKLEPQLKLNRLALEKKEYYCFVPIFSSGIGNENCKMVL